jgi:uncharacterized protein involved in outer membrane biogenesis
MKTFRRIVLVLVLLVVIAGVAVYYHLDSIIRSTVETQSSASLNLTTSLKSAKLALFGGKVDLNQFNIGSPKGFTAEHMFELGGLGVAVDYGQLTKEPVRIKTITINQPKFVLEQADGKMNFKAVMDSLPPTDPNAKTMKVIIDELTVTDALVDVRLGNVPGLGAMQPIQIKVPSMTLKNIGNADNAQNGAAMKDVVMQVATALAGKAGDSANFPDQLKGMLKSNLTEVAGKLGGEFTKQLGGITQSVQGELNKIAPGVDVNKDLDPGKALGGLLGGNKDKKKDK